MRRILMIYKRDMKNLKNNWVALVIIAGLIILPCLYAWFNIAASWDPYSNTDGIKVAIVNQDEGATFNSKEVSIGDEIKKNLEVNHDIGWEFVDYDYANKKINNGYYYAMIIIPKDFSKNVLSLTTTTIVSPVLEYYVNEKINAIAPKITDKASTTLKQQVDDNIVNVVTQTIFGVFNKVGADVTNLEPVLYRVIDTLKNINDKMPEIDVMMQQLDVMTINVEQIIDNVKKDEPIVDKSINLADELVDVISNRIDETQKKLPKIIEVIGTDLNLLKDVLNSIKTDLDKISTLDFTKVKQSLISIREKLITMNDKISFVIKVLEPFEKDQPKIKEFILKLKELDKKLDIIVNEIDLVLESNIFDTNAVKNLQDLIDNLKVSTDKLVDDYNNIYINEITKVIGTSKEIMDNTKTILTDAKILEPKIFDLVDKLDQGVNLTIEQINTLKANLPFIKNSIGQIVEKIDTLPPKEQVDQILRILQNDPQSEGDFLSAPVKIKHESLFPIPNYGSAMTPFYSVLAIWVGGLILVSLLSTNVHEFKNEKKLKSYEKYLGKYLLFLTFAMMQGLIIVMGDKFLLNTYAASDKLFILLGPFIAFIFVTIIYTLVSIFGNIGKAICVIFLVLQVAASGGTFPIELMPKFFKVIHPFLPFTYGINAMRESIGGVVISVLLYNIIILLLFLILSLLLGITLKGPINRRLKKYVDKLKESDLIGH